MENQNLFEQISSLVTEKRNEATRNIDIASTYQILEMISDQDVLVPLAVREQIDNIAIAVDIVTAAFKAGGRLFYVGAGTSGRLGILDASECPPTFGADPDMVQGIIAGGREAVFVAQEGAEDSEEKGRKEVIEREINPSDILCGIAASGRTPFVKGALEEARNRNIKTIIVSTCNREMLEKLDVIADVYICPQVGPEVIAGSTRMKSGTAQKLVLNMITTASMIRLGKIYENVMVDLMLTNQKLKERAKGIIMGITGVSYDEANKYLEKAHGHVKSALVMILAGVNYEKSQEMLKSANGFIRRATEKL